MAKRSDTGGFTAGHRAEERNDLLQGAIKILPDVMYLADLVEGRIDIVGGPCEQILGHPRSALNDLSTNSLVAMLHPRDVGAFEKHRSCTLELADDAVASIECRVRSIEGADKWVRIREQVFSRDAAGHVVKLIGAAASLQSRNDSKHALRLARTSLRRTLESVTDCYLTLDFTYRITDINRACLDWVGAKREELVGINFLDLFDDAAPCVALTKAAMEQRQPLQVEIPSSLRPDRWLSYRLYPSRSGVVVFFQDITDRKLAEQDARSSRGLLLAAINALSAQIAILDETGRIVDVNTAWHRFAACNGDADPEHGIGRNYLELFRASASDEPQIAYITDKLEAVLSGRSNSFHSEYENGDRRFLVKANRFDGNGSTYVVVAHEDITELALVRRTLTKLDDRQHHEISRIMRQSIVNRLSSSIAHELNQPLSAIMSNAEAAIALLGEKKVDIGTLREILLDIASEDKRAADVISRVRGLIRHDARQFEPITAARLLDATVALLRSEIVQSGILVEEDYDDSLPSIRGDFVELQQVLINLLMNAMEACNSVVPSGRDHRIVIRADKAEERVRLIVSDNGPGVPTTFESNLFEPFVSTKSGGLGLGLSICATIAEAHGGNITLKNNADRGASVILSLPIAKGEADHGKR